MGPSKLLDKTVRIKEKLFGIKYTFNTVHIDTIGLDREIDLVYKKRH